MCVWKDSFHMHEIVWRHLVICAMAYSYVYEDSFRCVWKDLGHVLWLWHVCNSMTSFGHMCYGLIIRVWRLIHVCVKRLISYTMTVTCVQYDMGWLRIVGSLKLQVSSAKEPYKRDDILQKRPIILRSLLTVATPYDWGICVTWRSHVCDMAFICVTWLPYVWRLWLRTHFVAVWHDLVICVTSCVMWLRVCVTWYSHMCDVAFIYVWHGFYMCDVFDGGGTLWHDVWHDLVMCVTSPCAMTGAYVWRDIVMCVTLRSKCVTWRSHVCDITCVWPRCVTWLWHMGDVT